MKKNLKIFFSLIAFGLFAVSTTLAQSFPVATMSSDEGVNLPTDDPLTDVYEIDFSTFNWTPENAQQGATYLDEKSDFITVDVDYPNLRLIVKLDRESDITRFWNLTQWNLHLDNVR